ncbi:hypothetical protein TH63_03365 [Rufibacter radiotolerans]|uniref:Uncharacterized protein n=1 Tax=Rufibacter radiotolerans TaxID=1379910 RepID=A0A0H4VHR8_9BACT|nr:hypothetical protein TH63_03365 [Rufibacter radiotolerans]
MILYDYLVYLILKKAKNLLPHIKDEQLEDGTYYTMNMVSGLYSIFLCSHILPTRIPSNYDPDEYIGPVVSLWVITVLINYFFIVRGRRWERIMNKYSTYSDNSKSWLTALTLVTWLGGFSILFYYSV